MVNKPSKVTELFFASIFSLLGGFLGFRKVTLGLFFVFLIQLSLLTLFFSKLQEFGPLCPLVSLLSKSIIQRNKIH